MFSNFRWFYYITFIKYVKRLSHFVSILSKTLLKLDFSQENVYYINEKLENLEKIMAFTTGERYRAYADWTPEYIEK